MTTRPHVTHGNYQSYMVSGYNTWFSEMGYPELDILTFEDGEWSIIQYHRQPIVPTLTPWSHVLTKMRHIEPSWDICRKWAEQLDLEKRHVWEEQEKLEARARQELAAEERHAKDFTDRAYTAIRSNPDLMNRIAKNGLGEMGLRQMARRIPNHHYR